MDEIKINLVRIIIRLITITGDFSKTPRRRHCQSTNWKIKLKQFLLYCPLWDSISVTEINPVNKSIQISLSHSICQMTKWQVIICGQKDVHVWEWSIFCTDRSLSKFQQNDLWVTMKAWLFLCVGLFYTHYWIMSDIQYICFCLKPKYLCNMGIKEASYRYIKCCQLSSIPFLIVGDF